jgi:DNA-binding transcriptional LysR family regulator
VSLTQLRYFVAVAEEGHFGRAARKVHVSQPPLSRQIRSLEDEVGAPLLERTRQGAVLTPSGRVLYERATAILESVDRARDEARRAAGAARGPTPRPTS